LPERRQDETTINHWCVQIRPKSPNLDGHGRDIVADARQIGLNHIDSVSCRRLYMFSGRLDENDMRLLADELLVDRSRSGTT